MKYLRESARPLCFIGALCGVYILFYSRLFDLVHAAAPTVRSFNGVLVTSWGMLLLVIAASVTYVTKASPLESPLSLAIVSGQGLIYLGMSAWMATIAFVAGATSGEGLVAVAGVGIAILGGVSFTSVCALTLMDRLEKGTQPSSGLSMSSAST